RLKLVDPWTVEAIEQAVREAGASLGMEGGQVIHPVRMALTGRTFGPGLFDLMEVIGRDRCVTRLRRAAGMLVSA
ncbi:MAG: glutamate--tRNA ligase, partial [Armatimonadota bacterium]